MKTAGEVARTWFEEFWNARAPHVAHAHADHETAFNGLDPNGNAVTGVENFLKFQGFMLAAFPDMHFHIEQVIDAGEMAAVRWTCHATHQGEWAGRQATGKPVRITGISMVRAKDGKTAETWDEWDRLGLLEQIGPVTS